MGTIEIHPVLCFTSLALNFKAKPFAYYLGLPLVNAVLFHAFYTAKDWGSIGKGGPLAFKADSKLGHTHSQKYPHSLRGALCIAVMQAKTCVCPTRAQDLLSARVYLKTVCKLSKVGVLREIVP